MTILLSTVAILGAYYFGSRFLLVFDDIHRLGRDPSKSVGGRDPLWDGWSTGSIPIQLYMIPIVGDGFLVHRIFSLFGVMIASLARGLSTKLRAMQMTRKKRKEEKEKKKASDALDAICRSSKPQEMLEYKEAEREVNEALDKYINTYIKRSRDDW
jgi:hypothetical protein